SCFTICLPIGAESEKASAAPNPLKVAADIAKTDTHVFHSSKKPVVLLVEDNDDMRFYLKDNLKHTFHIIEATNGKDGWQKALALHPKLFFCGCEIYFNKTSIY